jgi:hypothetical protein
MEVVADTPATRPGHAQDTLLDPRVLPRCVLRAKPIRGLGPGTGVSGTGAGIASRPPGLQAPWLLTGSIAGPSSCVSGGGRASARTRYTRGSSRAVSFRFDGCAMGRTST